MGFICNNCSSKQQCRCLGRHGKKKCEADCNELELQVKPDDDSIEIIPLFRRRPKSWPKGAEDGDDRSESSLAHGDLLSDDDDEPQQYTKTKTRSHLCAHWFNCHLRHHSSKKKDPESSLSVYGDKPRNYSGASRTLDAIMQCFWLCSPGCQQVEQP